MTLQPATASVSTRRDMLWLAVGGAVWLLAYVPLLRWLGQATLAADQLHTGALLVLFTTLFCLRSVRDRVRPDWRIGNLGLGLLGGAFALLFAATRRPVAALPLMLASFCFSALAVVSFAYGRTGVRAFLPAAAGLAGLGLMAGLVPALDWPLRAWAARCAGGILDQFGQHVRLALATNRPPALLLQVAGGTFEVAGECNGFGVLTSSLVLAAVLGFVHRLRWFRKLALLALAVPVALFANALRIVAISLLATRTTLPYAWIHEGIGLVFYAGALTLLWFLARQAGDATIRAEGHPAPTATDGPSP